MANEQNNLTNSTTMYFTTLGKNAVIVVIVVLLVGFNQIPNKWGKYTALVLLAILGSPVIAIIDQYMYSNLLMGIGFALGLIIMLPHMELKNLTGVSMSVPAVLP